MKWSKVELLGRVSNRKAIISLMVVAALMVTSAATAVALSPKVASIESTTPELSILNMTHDPEEALVDESVVWTVVVEVQEPAQLGKGLLFTWNWDDGSYTVYHMKSLISEPIAVNVQTHAWSEAGVYDVVVSVYDGYGPQKSRFHNVSATTLFMVKDFEPNTPPVASFYLWPEEGTVDTVFMFNANSSYDFEDPVESLLVRWDWESNGVWDTEYSVDQTAEHMYAAAGVYLVMLGVMDTGGLTDIAHANVTVEVASVLTPHDPIHIVGDEEFAAVAAAESWPGEGTENDPYVIELLNITGLEAPNAIWVESTTVFFIIRGCSLEGESSAVHMYDVENAAVLDNRFTSSPFYSIYCEQSQALRIEGNTILGGSHCIGVIESENFFLGNNTVENSGWWSLWIAYSHSVTLRDNRFYGSGIEITGYSISQWNTHDIDISNSVNGAPVYYFKDRVSGGVTPSYAGQVILANCTWMYISTYLTGSILLGFSSYNSIEQCSVRSVHYGITLMSSPKNFIMSTSVTDCYYGIYIVNSPGCMLNDTTVSGCAWGIWVHQSDGTVVSCNEVTGSEWTGVLLYSSSNCDVYRNVVSGSLQQGIRLIDARSNRITHNDFVDNWLQAYEEYESTGNLWDDGYPAGGNYWSDYDGVDHLSGVDQTEPGSDGIGDTPYVLVSGSQDNYPLMEPFASPNTAPTANFSVSAGSWEVWEIFEFDASSSWDLEDDLAELQVRWDWENDGAWDTSWSYDKMAYHVFEEPGEHFVVLEVVDTGGLTGTSVLGIYIPDDIEPTPPNTFYLPFATTDVVFDPERPYAYITDKYAMSLHFVNLTDGSVDQTFVFQYMTESLAMTPDGSRLFVALLTREHDPCWFEGQVGYIASIDLETQVKDREFMIDEDPFDLLATSNGQLVVSPGSGQWDYIRTYDATDGTPIGSAFIRHMSRLSMHPSEAIVYAADTDVSPSDITRFDLSPTGEITLEGNSPYHGEYEMAGDVWVNPLGDSLVVRGGHVLTAGMPFVKDMYYVTTMTSATPISDVEFDLANGLVLSLEGSQLCWYDIESYEALWNTSTGSDMEFLGLSGGTVYCVDAEWSSTTIIWFDRVSA